MSTSNRIFLAHAGEDKPQIRQLYADLKTRGFEPWLDEKDLIAGRNWKQEIRKAIRDAGVFLACLSSQSVQKTGYIQNEFRLALSAYGERPPGTIYLIPVRLDDCEVPDLEIPERGLSLRDIHWVDLSQEDGFDRLLSALAEALGTNATDEVTKKETAKQSSIAPTSDHLEPLSVFQDADVPWCPELVIISPGSFLMGSPVGEAGRGDVEGPRHKVSITQPFALGRFPVTRGQFSAFNAATGHDMSGGCRVRLEGVWTFGAVYSWRDPGFSQTDDHPVVGVSWHDARAYAEWLSKETSQAYRLPSEAEWEYAARAGTETRFYWGDKDPTPERANFRCKVGQTTEVGKYPANPWALRDMAGNVSEWVEDCWHENYKGAPSDGSAWLVEDHGDCDRRVYRGGSWGSDTAGLRSAVRYRCVAEYRSGDFGFRVARTLR